MNLLQIEEPRAEENPQNVLEDMGRNSRAPYVVCYEILQGEVGRGHA